MLDKQYFETKFLTNQLFQAIKIFTPTEQKLIIEAFNFAQIKHQGQKRLSGEDYINHPLRTALNVLQLKLDASSVISSLLHDILEDTSTSLEELESRFGKEIGFLVDGLTKVTSLKYQDRTLEELQKLSKFLIYLLDDLRVVFVKLADRLDNMRTLNFLPREKQIKVSQETKEIYLPLAMKLGISSWVGELDDLCFYYLEPDNYLFIQEYLNEKIAKGKELLETVKETIFKALVAKGIYPLTIEYRVKRISSIWKKFLKKKDIDKIYDVFALRVIVRTIEECYLTLGIIHQLFNPIFEEFDDYIAFPKPNGYQSIHTTVVYENEFIEVQIRTEAMHLYNELGVASYFAYYNFKETKAYQKGKVAFMSQEDIKIVEKLRRWTEIDNPREYLKLIKEEFFAEKVLVFTPKGDIIELPRGSTCIDFAYKIHTEIGNHCSGAKINGRLVPLSTELKTGDVVEILVNKNKQPSPDWLNIAKTYQARKSIKSYFKRKNITLSLEILVELPKDDLPQILSLINEYKGRILHKHLKIKNDRLIFKGILGFLNDKDEEKFLIKIKDMKNTILKNVIKF